MRHRVGFLLTGGIAAALGCLLAQDNAKKPPVPGPMLSQGTVDLATRDFTLTLVRSSQTVAALKAKDGSDFDFTPGDLLVARSQNKYFHLGDLTLRLREGTSGAWGNYSTAADRKPVIALPAAEGVLAAANLGPSLPSDIPLEIVRSWVLDNGKLSLRFTLRNRASQPVHIGALGIPLVFNNVLNDRTLEEAHAKCSFSDPYIGEDAGYVQVTRLSGKGPALLVMPDGDTPFEAYNPILDRRGRRDPTPELFLDPTPRGITFEGFYQWMVHSRAYAETEWKDARQWNTPTEVTLTPGESKTYGLKFALSDSIRGIENTLAQNARPVAVGIPGYILPEDLHARLFLKYPQKLRSFAVEPSGALEVTRESQSPGGWQSLSVQGKAWGRARLQLTYSNGLRQTIQYFVTKPAAQAVADMGRFLTTQQWFTDRSDPFHRAPSVMTYDREQNHIVLQDSRVWIAGLSDEGGAGSWLAAVMKELGQPDKTEIHKLDEFIDQVIWGRLQQKDGPHQYGVRKSLFYYAPDEFPGYYRGDLNWKSWTSWNRQASEAVDRSYNYPHVAAAYWVLYQLARNNDGLETLHPWQWYLDHAYQTAMAMPHYAEGLAEFGQMEGDIFLRILIDLKREGKQAEADTLEAAMRKRADHWKEQAYPFGSEMPWDSTGQEEVYAWTKYFGYGEKAAVTLNAILGYDPAIPHWGYNGSARRYWDFIFGASAKYSRIERQLHHYGSGINAIPLLSEYREHPNDFYLLRVGYAGTSGALADIDQEGFLAPAFHGFPDMLRFDPLSGDNGPNFFGHAWNTATYLVHHPEFGWVAFGGNVTAHSGEIELTPLDSFRTRVYMAPFGVWLTLDSGKFQSVRVNEKSGIIRVGLAPSDGVSSEARIHIDHPATEVKTDYHLRGKFGQERGAFAVPLGKQTTWIELSP